MNLSKNIKKYSNLILKKGINLKEGENLVISASINAKELVRALSKKAYKLGANDVVVLYQDMDLQIDRFKYANDSSFEEFPKFKVDFLLDMVDQKYHRISIVSDDPEAFKKSDKERLSKWSKVSSMATMPLMQRVMNNEVKWCVVASSSKAWGKKLFPKLSAKDAEKKLWKLIFKITRVDKKDPIKAWEEHDSRLKKYENFLNEANFEKLHYEAPGTDLEVYMAKHHKWIGGSADSADGDVFIANIPTEEIFSMPHAYKVNGTLSSTKPLYFMSNVIDGMKFEFKDGKVVNYSAKEGEEVLDILMNIDEGSVRLGEVAIVPDDSPISNSNVLFKNTLYDENASCHFAFGKAYTENTKVDNLSNKNRKKIGMNDSMTHVDFMVGGPKLKITGYKHDGEKVIILEDGNWKI